MATTKLSSKKKMRNTLFVVFLILICLIVRIGYIQFIKGEELIKQYTHMSSYPSGF